MKYSNFHIFCTILSVMFFLVFTACEKEENDVDPDDIDSIVYTNLDIYEGMNEIYYWYQHVPELKPGSYTDPYELMDDLKYEEDRFSFVIPTETFIEFFEEGISTGHGYGVAADHSGSVRVAYVIKGSPAHKHSVRRGWRIKSINGNSANVDNYYSLIGDEGVTSNEITFVTTNGESVQKNIEKEVITLNPVLFDSVYTVNQHKIGYVVFLDFIETGVGALDKVFETFKTANVDRLVIDLRYNGGGLNTVAEHFANLIAGNDYNNELFYTYKHNDKYAQYLDTTVYFKPVAHSLINVKELYFIGTYNTASASELLINGLSTYYPTKLIGSDTYGKPVGMYVIETRHHYSYAPVSFRLENSVGNADYFNGIPADYEASDNLDFEFGNVNEPGLSTAFTLVNGNIPVSSKRNYVFYKRLNNNPLTQNFIKRKAID